VREALSLQDRYNAELESARRNSANAARDAYTGVNYGLAQVRALESAEVSARTQLDSTQLGYQVGVRILLDVLNAQTQLLQTQRDLKRARYDFLLAALRLKASSGSLTDEDVIGVNALLDPAVPLTVPDITTPERTSSMVPPARPPARTAPKADSATPAASSAPAKPAKTGAASKSTRAKRTARS
jgi:outer membrane protein